MKTIGVIFGGKSLEHDISILTGLQVIAHLKADYDVVPIFIDKQGEWWTGDKLIMLETYTNFNSKCAKKCFIQPHSKNLFIKSALKTKQKKLDIVFLALHGQNGEDGAIQGLLNLCEIPFSSCDVLSSAITMDKAFCKMVLKQNGIDTPNFKTFYQYQWTNQNEVMQEIENEFGFDVVVKPARAGSSIGVARCFSKQDIQKAIEVAFCFDTKIIVEQAVKDFKEVNIACIGDQKGSRVSVFEEVKSNHEILDFDEKYINTDKVTRTVDAKLDFKTSKKIIQMAKKAFSVCECFGVVRMDFFVTESNVFLNEINSIPGSMANYLFKDLKFSHLCDILIGLAEKRAEEKNKLLKTYDSNALNAFGNISNSKIFK